MNRVKILKVSPGFILGIAKHGVPQCKVAKNPLPPDTEILQAMVDFGTNSIAFKLQSHDFPEVGDGQVIPELPDVHFEMQCPHLATAGSVPRTVTLTRDDLATLLYDADRQPGRRLTIEVRADGTWEAKGVER